MGSGKQKFLGCAPRPLLLLLSISLLLQSHPGSPTAQKSSRASLVGARGQAVAGGGQCGWVVSPLEVGDMVFWPLASFFLGLEDFPFSLSMLSPECGLGAMEAFIRPVWVKGVHREGKCGDPGNVQEVSTWMSLVFCSVGDFKQSVVKQKHSQLCSCPYRCPN